MNTPLDIKKLQLPVPARLVPLAHTAASNVLQAGALVEFLASGLQDSTGIEAWLEGQGSATAMADYPLLSELEKLSPRQKIYDSYFDVCRHGGSTASLAYALGQVMGEISRELQVGSGLDESELKCLFDGLAAVLEAAGER